MVYHHDSIVEAKLSKKQIYQIFKNTRKKIFISFCFFVGNFKATLFYNKKMYAYFTMCIQNLLRILLHVIKDKNCSPYGLLVFVGAALLCQ